MTVSVLSPTSKRHEALCHLSCCHLEGHIPEDVADLYCGNNKKNSFYEIARDCPFQPSEQLSRLEA